MDYIIFSKLIAFFFPAMFASFNKNAYCAC